MQLPGSCWRDGHHRASIYTAQIGATGPHRRQIPRPAGGGQNGWAGSFGGVMDPRAMGCNRAGALDGRLGWALQRPLRMGGAAARAAPRRALGGLGAACGCSLGALAGGRGRALGARVGARGCALGAL